MTQGPQPPSGQTRSYNVYHDISELPPHIFDEMTHFFQVYKALENKETAVDEVKGAGEAVKVVSKCIEMYQEGFCGKNRREDETPNKK